MSIKPILVYSAIAFAGIVVALLAAVGIGTVLWNRTSARVVSRLGGATGADENAAPPPFSADHLSDLPAPVRRYFQFALAPGRPFVRSAVLHQQGEFSMRPGQWAPFTAVERFAVHPPGFLWDASIRLAPLVSVLVRDSYLEGAGETRAAIGGVVTVAHLHDTPEMAAGALVRYLAEAVWLPTALLPSEGVTWSPVDDSTARATVTDGSTTVSLDVRFGADGEIVRMSTMRHRAVKGAMILTPWVGYFREYQRIDGMTVPMSGEVEWLAPEGRIPYWRGRIVGTQYR